MPSIHTELQNLNAKWREMVHRAVRSARMKGVLASVLHWLSDGVQS
jgi:hypothetical protein